MREIYEFRVPEARASVHLPPGVGVVSGTGIARKLTTSANDDLFAEIGRLERRMRDEGDVFFTSWSVRRSYSRSELQRAQLFRVWPLRVLEPAGEECGTVYDDSSACPLCGGGGVQTSELWLPRRAIPSVPDVWETIAGEIVVTARTRGLYRTNGFTGAKFGDLRLSDEGGRISDSHFQMSIDGRCAELDATTRAGEDPFDQGGYGRCPTGDVIGLNLLSPVVVAALGDDAPDVMASSELVGVRRGLLRPRPLLLVSACVWDAMAAAKLNGFGHEIAYVAG